MNCFHNCECVVAPSALARRRLPGMHRFSLASAVAAALVTLPASLPTSAFSAEMPGQTLDLSRPRSVCGAKVIVDHPGSVSFLHPVAAHHAASQACDYHRRSVCDVADDDRVFWSDFTLRRRINGFCEQQDRVYDVRCLRPGTGEVRYLVWVNGRSGAALIWGESQMMPALVPPPSEDEMPTLRVGKMTLDGAKVASPRDAAKAIRASYPSYILKKDEWNTGGYPTRVTSIKVLAEDVPPFAKKGDRVWEAIRWAGHFGKTLVWVHADTARLHFLTERWEADSNPFIFGPKPLSMKTREPLIGIDTYEKARAAVMKVRQPTNTNAEIVCWFASFVAKRELGLRIPAMGGIGMEHVMRLGFDIPDFAKRGDRIWECHLGDFGGVLAVIWVNPRAGTAFIPDHMFETTLAGSKEGS